MADALDAAIGALLAASEYEKYGTAWRAVRDAAREVYGVGSGRDSTSLGETQRASPTVPSHRSFAKVCEEVAAFEANVAEQLRWQSGEEQEQVASEYRAAALRALAALVRRVEQWQNAPVSEDFDHICERSESGATLLERLAAGHQEGRTE